jgi:integrase
MIVLCDLGAARLSRTARTASATGFANFAMRPDVPASPPHGLRKAAARWLAEIGCSAHEIASITGHATLAEVRRYTKAADRKRLARSAMRKLIGGGEGGA